MSGCDVIIVGFGYAGGIAAIAAHDAGAHVLLLEKQPDPGGISVCSAGGVRCNDRPDDALAYLVATNAGTTPEPVLRALAEGMCELPGFVGDLAEAIGAKVSLRPAPGNYPFPGYDSFAFINVDTVPDFDPRTTFPTVRGAEAGARLFQVVLENVRRRGIEVRFGMAAEPSGCWSSGAVSRGWLPTVSSCVPVAVWCWRPGGSKVTLRCSGNSGP